MFNTSWPILLVDDEPDVLQLSRLVMQDFTVYGLPVELHTAASKAEAIELMETELIPLLPTVPAPRVAVAFIDVVMETDTAGLELCELHPGDDGQQGRPALHPHRPTRRCSRASRDRPLRHQRLLHQGRSHRGQAVLAGQDRRAAVPLLLGGDGDVDDDVGRHQCRPARAIRSEVSCR